ncbi:hypothetical protein [Parabacteroides distasonis]|nr:hypothetical protein [Parabacteroides distasonis]NBH89154.1 hypothetical protein [Parabacteroides distasonis]
MNTKHLKLSVLLAVCLISSCTNEDMGIQSVNDQKPKNTNILNIDEAKNLLEDFVADAFTKSKSSFEIKEHKTKTLYIDNTEALPVSVKDTIPIYEFTTEMDGQKGYSIVVGDKRIEKVHICTHRFFIGYIVH